MLPRPLQWLTANIGLHHVHHLSSRIPNYRLEECMNANADLQRATRVTLKDSFRLMRLSLWDEERARLSTASATSPTLPPGGFCYLSSSQSITSY